MLVESRRLLEKFGCRELLEGIKEQVWTVGQVYKRDSKKNLYIGSGSWPSSIAVVGVRFEYPYAYELTRNTGTRENPSSIGINLYRLSSENIFLEILASAEDNQLIIQNGAWQGPNEIKRAIRTSEKIDTNQADAQELLINALARGSRIGVDLAKKAEDERRRIDSLGRKIVS